MCASFAKIVGRLRGVAEGLDKAVGMCYLDNMRIPRIYLETTIFNFPFADDAPDLKAGTIRLFRAIEAGKFIPYTSQYVVDELEDTKSAEKREKMKALIADYGVETIPESKEAERLARIYVKEGIIKAKYEADAIHIAMATITNLDFIISLNFQHIVKRKTIIETEIINAREGYRRVYIYTPMEVIDYAENT